MKRSSFVFIALGFEAFVASATGPAMARKLAVQTFPDGLQFVDLKTGHGPMPKTGQTVSVQYVGRLTSGTVFDRSSDHDGPFSFVIGQGQVIKGWDEGVATMRVGGSRRLTVPPDLGYGDRAMGPIPPNSTLVFDIQLLGVK